MIKEPWASPGEGDPGGGAGTDDIRPEDPEPGRRHSLLPRLPLPLSCPHCHCRHHLSGTESTLLKTGLARSPS